MNNEREQAISNRGFRHQAANTLEKHEELAGSDATHGCSAIDKCIHELFEQQVERAPEATAVVFKQQRLSYRELNERANQVAHHLSTLGVAPGSLVGICVERSLDMAIGLLGILKAGGAYLPLDPAYPKERLEFMLKDAGISLLLTQQQLSHEFELGSLSSDLALRVVLLDRDWQTIETQSRENPVSESHPENLAYVIYTSGSTGRPKGVLIPHRAVVNHNLAVAKMFSLHTGDRVAQCASLSFDIAVEELFPSWITGATVVLYPSRFCCPDPEFSRWAEEEQITVLDLATAFWHAWVL
jgi:non-ribosomal peptide synthetase component F